MRRGEKGKAIESTHRTEKGFLRHNAVKPLRISLPCFVILPLTSGGNTRGSTRVNTGEVECDGVKQKTGHCHHHQPHAHCRYFYRIQTLPELIPNPSQPALLLHHGTEKAPLSRAKRWLI
ncbi:uncharacterized protein LOC121587617 [Anopheles merus]|uniref:uncharacterized protein LOC121587617 n=1 Tax=Anopheles merus TaxID=30066 RepID=UPI001BE411EA|nr:uncharacterized protein LOC121587617 [Anopheles merus]